MRGFCPVAKKDLTKVLTILSVGVTCYIMDETFTSFDLCKRLNISRPTLQDWIARGFIEPAVKAEGKGTKNLFTRDNLYQIELFRILVGRGFNRAEVGRWVADISFMDHLKIQDFLSRTALGESLGQSVFMVVAVKGSESITDVAGVSDFSGMETFFQEELSGFDEIHFIRLNYVIEKIDKIFR
jgi:DNA-binding transcriptional MerR regulator